MLGNMMATLGAKSWWYGKRGGNSLIPPGEGAQGRREQPGQGQAGGHEVRLLAPCYLLNHLLVLQKTLFQTPLPESLSAISQEKQLNPDGRN